MNVSVCTISFRHMLLSFADIAQYVHEQQFQAIELWGVHAKSLSQGGAAVIEHCLSLLKLYHIEISMISDYIDVSPQVDRNASILKCDELIALAHQFGTNKIRTFAGKAASQSVNSHEREMIVNHLQIIGNRCAAAGIMLLIETHPYTLADHTESTLQLMKEVRHDAVKVNLDFLHLWEAGDDPLASYGQLQNWVENFHLKNITSLDNCKVFDSNNVYAPSGSRYGIVPLSDGQVDYTSILRAIHKSGKNASLEWFGDDPLRYLAQDRQWIQHIV
ncbi:sugar phosphate isomerase/epimerase family protein [Paenibacillus arenosi]|uniref:Sugar phosphate isomerase/epimerase n=1 Tax=Paenibacillus arenosi TaxID=2774142 RepID=A0ABR9AUL4_9BACL|nr:sugar phosphate isomerase/epimerase family protein [Paenibacillus arenosi]MBD8497774.1 sugar phosphate isomerase/epimerase [Paenibacillus arenosi]